MISRMLILRLYVHHHHCFVGLLVPWLAGLFVVVLAMSVCGSLS